MAFESRPATVRAFRLRHGKTWHQVATDDLARELAACYARLEGLKRQIRTLETLERRRQAWERD